MNEIEKLELKLDSFDQHERKEALAELLAMASAGDIDLPSAGTDVNLHLHSFYSYNACNYSPTKIAWKAKATAERRLNRITSINLFFLK